MPAFTRLTAESDLPTEGEVKEFRCADKVICVANSAGNFSAMDNLCLHMGGPLGQGFVESGKVVCPWHGWQWDPVTGEAGHNPKAKMAVYPLKVVGGDVLVEI